MVERESWESDLLNIIWGLVNGEAHLLGDIAKEFALMEYQISSIEKRYSGKGIIACPDIVLHSNKLQHIWVIELTVNHFDRKKDQLMKYEQLDSKFFSIVVPFYDKKTVDVSVIVSSDVQSEYERGICEEEDLERMILIVYNDQDKILIKVCGQFCYGQINAFFNVPIKFNRIPQAIPYYPFHDMSHPLWKKYFALALIELLSRDINANIEINPKDLVRFVFPEGIYNKIGSAKLKEIRKIAKYFLEGIYRIDYIGKYMEKEKNKDVYRFDLPIKKKERILGVIRKYLNAWINSGMLF